MPEKLKNYEKNDSINEETIIISKKNKMTKNPWKLISSLNKDQAITFLCAWSGWMLDAFDFSIFTYTLPYIAQEFNLKTSVIASSITITLILRPVGAFIFGLAAERYGRRYPLMINVLLFSLLELASGFAPNYRVFLALRALFGIMIGGEWGLGATLAMEALPLESRGFFSGILQHGNAFGGLLAAGLYYVGIDRLGWRPLFWIASFPAFLVIIIRFWVPESEVWRQQRDERNSNKKQWSWEVKNCLVNHWVILLYGIIFLSVLSLPRGISDLFPTYLKTQLGFNPGQIFTIMSFGSVGAILGGTICGHISQYWGRRRTIIIAAFFSGCCIPLISLTKNIFVICFGVFILGFLLQGYWGVIPAHLTEIAPPSIRSLFVSFVFQSGSLVGAYSAEVEATFAEKFALPDGTPNYAVVQAVILGISTVLIIIVTALGREAKDVNFNQQVAREGLKNGNNEQELKIDDEKVIHISKN
ncbi:hypothetical protein G9A89_010625 [Geosiphon pyriformis]|nr:hypothetical protein G9A89_010625 [Geosiphon pyriformis]